MTSQFWAAAEGPELAKEVHLKVHRYFLALEHQGLIARYRDQYQAYFMRSDDGRDGSTLDLGTRKKPKVAIRVPEARSLLRQQLAFVLSEPVSYQVVSSVGDQSSVMSSELAEKAVNYKMKAHVNEHIPLFAEIATVYGASGTHMRWAPETGDTVQEPAFTADPVTGQQTPLIVQGPQGPQVATQEGKSGAPDLTVLDPTMIAYDPLIGEKAGWAVAFERTNLHVLAARYPDRAEQILNLNCRDRYDAYRIRSELRVQIGGNDKDVVAMHWYYADRPELPGGRYALIVDDEVVELINSCPLPDGRLPVRWICTAPITDSALSFCDGFGLLPVDSALNNLRSSELSNYAYYGAQTRWSEEGTRVVPAEDLSGGVREIKSPRGGQMPRMLEVQPMPPGAEALRRDLIECMPRVSGFGDVARGKIDKTSSGVHVTAAEAISARNLSLSQAALTRHLEHLANDLLDLMREFGNQTFFVELAGKGSDGTIARELTYESLRGVRKITASAVPEGLRGPTSRIALLESLTKAGIEDPRERAKAIAFVTRGDDEFGRNDQRRTNLIAVENERLRSGQASVVAVATQDHYSHITDHAADLDEYLTTDEPDPAVIERYAAHITEHTELIENQEPVTAMALGLPAPPILPGNPAQTFAMRQQEAQMQIAPPPPMPPDDGAPTEEPMQ